MHCSGEGGYSPRSPSALLTFKSAAQLAVKNRDSVEELLDPLCWRGGSRTGLSDHAGSLYELPVEGVQVGAGGVGGEAIHSEHGRHLLSPLGPRVPRRACIGAAVDRVSHGRRG